MIIRLLATLCIIFIVITSPVYAQDIKTGSYIMQSSANEILGDDLAASYASLIDLDLNITWEIDVPEDYDPANPPGIMVYISPQNIIKLPAGWLSVTREKNMIFIAARMSGNKEPVNQRIVMAILSLPLIQSSYKVDTDRIYVSGFSGGGRIASMVATNFPHIFNGALYNCGVNFWHQISPEQRELIKNNRYVFLTGSNDFNLQDTKKIYSKYKNADVKNIKLMVIARMSHSNPKRNKFSQALDFLDENG